MLGPPPMVRRLTVLEEVMGRAKEAMLVHHENMGRAAGYLVSAGKLTQCPIHSELYDGSFFGLDDEFYRNAMADRKRGDSGPVYWASDLTTREFTDLLKQTYEEYSGADSCGRCAKNAED